MKKVYVCSALRGNQEGNIKLARIYCEYVVREFGHIPVAPHIYFTQFLDDNNSQDREFGISAGLSLLSECDELWYFGDRVTREMTNEICFALKYGIRVKYISEHLYEQYKTERIMTHEM